MSFNKDLTGSSNLYANVILNTNVCASTVSTVNLSATNASFTNITTNTWTTGNVSTPNVIATNGYFSTVNASNFNVSFLYVSNASYENISVLSNMTVPNISALQVINGSGQLRLQNNGGIVVKDIDTSDPSIIQLNYASTPSIETYGLYLETNKSESNAYARIGAGVNASLQFYADDIPQAENTSTTGWTFYNTINSSFQTNLSNLSVSNQNASTINSITMNTCNLNVCGNSTTLVYSSGLTLRNISVNPTTNYMSDPTKLALNYTFMNFGVSTETAGLTLKTDQTNAIVDINAQIPFAITHNAVSALTHVRNSAIDRKWTFYSDIYNACRTYLSSVSVSNLSAVNFNVSSFTASSIIVPSSGYISLIYTSGVANYGRYINLSRDAFGDPYTTLKIENQDLTLNGSTKPAVWFDGFSVSHLRFVFEEGTYEPMRINLSGVSVSNLQVTANISVDTINTSNLYNKFGYVSELYAKDILSSQGVLLFKKSDGVTILSSQSVSNPNSSNPLMIYDGFNIDKYYFNVSDGSTALFFDKNNICALSSSVYVSYVSVKGISSAMVSSTSMATSKLSVSNISVTNTSVTTITGTTTNFSTVNASTLSFSNSLVNICVSNIYGSQIVLTQNGTVSQYGYMQYGAGKFFVMSQGSLANSLVMGNSGNARFEISSAGVSSYVPFYVSTGNFSTLNASNFNPANIVTTTLTASTLNASNLNASVFNPATINTSTINTCNLSVNNISSVYKITSDSIINVSCDALNIRSIYASVGGIPYLQMDYWKSASSTQERGFTIFSDETRGSIIDGGTLALELRQDDVTQVTNTSTNGWTFNNKINTSYQNNFSKLAVSNLSVSTITIPSITTTTVTVSTINNSVINSDTGNIITLNTTTANISTINSSTITNSSGTFTTMSNNTIYSSIINVSRINNTSAYVSNMSVSNFSCITLATFANISSTSMRSTSYYGTHISVSNICVSYMSITRANVSNVCVSYVSSFDMTTETFNASSVTCDVAYPAYIVNTGGGNFSQICYFDNISVDNINNSIRIDNPTTPLYINSTNNTATTGIRVPNYIDGQDLGTGFTIGYNHTTGFINCCRATRFYGNLLTDSNLNTITNTASLGIGQNITSGDIKIGSTTMTGNISIDTTGDVVFGCDRRSTWNTSDLIKFSTQLGSHVYSNSLSNINKVTTGQTFCFSPINANVSMSTFPVGLYLVSAHARIKTNGGYNANITQMNAGMCYGTGYNFTSGNTTRMALAALGALNTSGTTNFIQNIPFTSVLNMSITGQYIGAFMSATAGQAATVGSIDLTIDYITIVKLA